MAKLNRFLLQGYLEQYVNVIVYLCIKMKQFIIVSAPRSATIESYGWLNKVQIHEPFDLIHILRTINDRSSLLSIKHTTKSKEFEFQKKNKNIHKQQ